LAISNSVYLSANTAGAALTNYGTVLWTGPNIYGFGNSVIYNAGLWQDLADNSLSNQCGTNTFLNVGTFQKAAGTGTTTISWAFNTTGMMEVRTGTLSL